MGKYMRIVFAVWLCMLIPVTVVQAQPTSFEWTNESSYSMLWIDPLNWNPNTGVPGEGDTAIINSPPWRGPIVASNVTVGDIVGPLGTQVVDVMDGTLVVDSDWSWRDGSGTGTINVSGSPSIVILGSGDQAWRAPDNGTGIINISGDPNIYVEGEWRGAGGQGTFIVNMNGGRAQCKALKWGNSGTGELNMSGGTIIVRHDMSLGGGSPGPVTVNMEGGLITVGKKFLAPSHANRTCQLNLHGGTIDCNEFVHGTEDTGFSDQWQLDITEGEMIIDGDVTAAIDANVAVGRITAYGGIGTVLVDYDISNPGKTTVKGSISSVATTPSPEHGAEDLGADGLVLGWEPGAYASSRNVYFGTNWADVNDVNSSNVASYPNVDYYHVDVCSCAPGVLELGTTYYWRVDEVNDSCDASPWKGSVWQFTVEHFFMMVDDFESYDGLSTPISDAWLDGSSNGTNSAIFLGTSGSGNPVHYGNQSMAFEYHNGVDGGLGYYSEIEANTTDLQAGYDWTVQGIGVLTVWFYGDADNDANATEQMYVALEDTRGPGSYAEVRYKDTNDIKKEEWQECNIRLQDFPDVNLASVKKIYIGFGGRINPTVPGGDGIVHFEDIRLYRVGRGIWVTSHAPSSFIIGPIDYVDIAFSSDVDDSSFSVADINMVGPSGPIEVNSPENRGDHIWRISFPQQSALGEYHLYIGPHIEDPNGNEMDQDADRTPAEEPEDVYDAAFILSDSTPPAVISIKRQTPPQQLTNASQVMFSVVFSESVSGVQANNFSIDATGDQTGAIIQSVAGSDENWMVTVDAVVGDGSLSIDLDQNLSNIVDLTQLPMTEAFSTGETYNIDRTAPAVTLGSEAPDPTNTSLIPVTVTLSEPSTSFESEDITPTNATVSDFSGSGTSYTFNLVPAGQGLVSATIEAGAFTDAADNNNIAALPLSRTYDSISPVVTLDSAAPDPTNASSLPVTVTLSEPSTNFTGEDVTLRTRQ
jgi:hypothetical protein